MHALLHVPFISPLRSEHRFVRGSALVLLILIDAGSIRERLRSANRARFADEGP